MDPMQNLNNAADALNQVAQRAGAFWDQADAEIAQRQAAYDALEANLRGVVADEMYFAAEWKPSQPSNPVKNGSFQSLQSLVNAAPYGAHILVRMFNDEAYDFTENFYITNKDVRLYGMNGNDVGLRPTLDCPVIDSGTYTSFQGQFALWNSTLRFERINIALGPKGASPWSNQKSIVNAYGTQAGAASVSMVQSKATGSDGAGIVRTHVGGIIGFSSYLAELDGNIHAVPDATYGVTMLSNYALTLSNGATTRSGGTLGTNVLEG